MVLTVVWESWAAQHGTVSSVDRWPLSSKLTLAGPFKCFPLAGIYHSICPQRPLGRRSWRKGLSSVALGCLSSWQPPQCVWLQAPAPASAGWSRWTSAPQGFGSTALQPRQHPAVCPGPIALTLRGHMSSQFQRPEFQQVPRAHSTATCLSSSETGLRPLQLIRTFWALAGAGASLSLDLSPGDRVASPSASPRVPRDPFLRRSQSLVAPPPFSLNSANPTFPVGISVWFLPPGCAVVSVSTGLCHLLRRRNTSVSISEAGAAPGNRPFPGSCGGFLRACGCSPQDGVTE